jgi:hypothetical protein
LPFGSILPLKTQENCIPTLHSKQHQQLLAQKKVIFDQHERWSFLLNAIGNVTILHLYRRALPDLSSSI